MTTQTIVAELGTDFSPWKSEAHFASWLGLTPSRDISGGKVIRQESRKVKNPVAAALRMAASSLLRSESYLGARYRSLRTRLGAPKAIKAMARYLACLVSGCLPMAKPGSTEGQNILSKSATSRISFP
jgi:transposase